MLVVYIWLKNGLWCTWFWSEIDYDGFVWWWEGPKPCYMTLRCDFGWGIDLSWKEITNTQAWIQGLKQANRIQARVQENPCTNDWIMDSLNSCLDIETPLKLSLGSLNWD